jgi:thiol:disulfide interchange protein
MGLGLALPYLLLAVAPPLARLMPKPGPWMVRFRQALAFPMYATAAWLIWVLTQQVGPDAAFLTTLGLILLAAGLWLWPAALPHTGGAGEKLRIAGCLAALVGAGGLLTSATLQPSKIGRVGQAAVVAEPFSTTRLERLRAEGRPVFVNITAAWCISCKVNERVALSGGDFNAAMKRHSVAYLRGDWTNQDPEITDFLRRFGRAGVPLYVLFAGDGSAPRVLPQILDPGAVRRALETAAPARAARFATNRR